MRVKDEPWYPVGRTYDTPTSRYLYYTNDGSPIFLDRCLSADLTKSELLAYIKKHWYRMHAQRSEAARQAFEAYHDLKARAMIGEPGTIIIKSPDSEVKLSTRNLEGEITMFGEFKAYVSRHRDIIFTILLVGIMDHFFLGGALKSRIKSILEGVTRRLEVAVAKDLDGDGVVGAPEQGADRA